MLRMNFKQWRLVRYTCSPVPIGKVSVVSGVVFAVLCGVCALAGDKLPETYLGVNVFCALACFGYGFYCLVLRRKPFKREIVLGTPLHRLFLRSRWLFVAIIFVVDAVGCIAALAAVVAIRKGLGALPGEFGTALRNCGAVLYVAVWGVVLTYLAYSRYYRSPEYLATLQQE